MYKGFRGAIIGEYAVLKTNPVQVPPLRHWKYTRSLGSTACFVVRVRLTLRRRYNPADLLERLY
jgi:hypothetical protein